MKIVPRSACNIGHRAFVANQAVDVPEQDGHLLIRLGFAEAIPESTPPSAAAPARRPPPNLPAS